VLIDFSKIGAKVKGISQFGNLIMCQLGVVWEDPDLPAQEFLIPRNHYQIIELPNYQIDPLFCEKKFAVLHTK
jgi:hypothetical protein